ncbi:MAG: DNA-processing protein DprA [Myxococcota bacterium]
MRVPDHHKAALHLAMAGGFGPQAFHALRGAGNAAAMLQLPEETVRDKLATKQVTAWRAAREAFHNGHDRRIQESLELLASGKAALVTPDDPGYPAAFQGEPWAPGLLFISGGRLAEALKRPCVAVVGSREASPYGLDVARRLGKELGKAGVTVVSGCAEGVDSAAHTGAMDAGGLTVAVMGAAPLKSDGSVEIRRRIPAYGGSISEIPPDMEKHPGTYVQRNRLISGLSRAVVVVEGVEGSGSASTAGAALSQGRILFAVPGEITRPLSFTPNELIRLGKAKMLTGAHDVLEALGLRGNGLQAWSNTPERPAVSEPPPELDGTLATVFGALSPVAEVAVDDVAEKCGLSAAEAARGLLELELRGLCRRERGGVYTRLA